MWLVNAELCYVYYSPKHVLKDDQNNNVDVYV